MDAWIRAIKMWRSIHKKPLKKLDDMPEHLKFNPFVLTGYRPLLTFSECLQSLFYFHNETLNIITHGIPIVFIMCFVPKLLPWDEAYFLSWCHLCGIVCPWIGSFCYHLFMNWDIGERFYQNLLMFDMLGVWICQSFGAFPMIAVSTYCFHTSLRILFFIFYSLLCIWGLYKAMRAWSPWERRFCFFLPFMMRTIIYVLRIVNITGGNPDAISYVFLQDYLSLIGGIIGAIHIPERWFPGLLDYYLNSHNIMHVLVLMAVYCMHQATLLDFKWFLDSKNCL